TSILHSSLLCDSVITFPSIGIKSHGVDCLDSCLIEFRVCVLRLLVKFVGFAFSENFVLHRYTEQGPLLWPSVEEDGVTRLKKYSELSTVEAIQADSDVKATNIILQGLPPE
nr:hypothetical protein [Tanacetum cinerariifolium]